MMPKATSVRYRAYRHSQGKVRVADLDVHPDELAQTLGHVVLVAPTFAGICTADIRELRAERPGRNDFGHEVVGTVVASTHPVYSTGDCVVLNPFVKIHRETAYAELMYLAGAYDPLSSALMRVPSDGIQFSIVEPLACTIHAARQSLTDIGRPKLVIGAGFFGFLMYRYLEELQAPVTLANRSHDRLAHLLRQVGEMTIAIDLERYQREFATVFLMQSRVSRADVASAARLVCDEGEVVLFGAIDRNEDETLYKTRNTQQRVSCFQQGKRYHVQGTLDATTADMKEAIAMLSRPKFWRGISGIFAKPLTFEQGAAHLTERALAPRSQQKYVIAMNGGRGPT